MAGILSLLCAKVGQPGRSWSRLRADVQARVLAILITGGGTGESVDRSRKLYGACNRRFTAEPNMLKLIPDDLDFIGEKDGLVTMPARGKLWFNVQFVGRGMSLPIAWQGWAALIAFAAASVMCMLALRGGARELCQAALFIAIFILIRTKRA